MIQWLEKNRIFSVILLILVVAEIFFFSSIPGTTASPGTALKVSVLYHFSVFFLLNFFLMVSLNGRKDIKIKYLVIALIFSVIYSVLDEIHQLFVPFRTTDLEDILIDNMGVFTSGLVYAYYKSKFKINQ